MADPRPHSPAAVPSGRGGPIASTSPTGRHLAAVVVTYNSSGVVGECLSSLRAALAEVGLDDSAVVVVDNASTDDTLEVVRTVVPTATVLARPRNDGFAAGVNAGCAAVSAADVLILNPDVRLHPGALIRLWERAAAPGVGIAVPRLLDHDGGLQLSLRREPSAFRALSEAVLGGKRAGRWSRLGEVISDEEVYRATRLVDWATGAAWLVTRECLTGIGAMDERYFLYSEETEFMLRARDHGFATAYVPDAVAVHLGGEQASSPRLWALSVTNRVRMQRERHGAVAGLSMWLATALNETVRAVGRGAADGARHRVALRSLVRFRPWPAEHRPVTDHVPYVCFAAQDWWYHNQAHSDFQLMRSIAEQRKVLVVNSIGMRMPTPGRSTHTARRLLRKVRSVGKFVRRPIRELPGFYVMSPLPLPLYGSPALRRLGAALVRAQVSAVCAALRIHRPVIVVTIPTAWDVVRPMSRTSLVYNRSDRHSDFQEADRQTIERLERQLLAHSDRVLYVSRVLMDEEKYLTGGRELFLDHGVDLNHFRRRPAGELPQDIAGIPAPRVGFFGALDGLVVDFDLLEHLAEDLPDASLVLIGDADHPMGRFDRYPNVHWLGRRPYGDIPAYGSSFDVAIMPWVDSDWIQRSNPIKLKEYLALGLPIVSRPFEELADYRDRVRVANRPDEFVAAIRLTLVDGGPSTPAARRESVRPWSWQSRAALLMCVAEEHRKTDDRGAGAGLEPRLAEQAV